ncbi:MAG: PorT family protein [Mediterranea sp.]|nr:PorT family protein [Mediterranea sp.]
MRKTVVLALFALVSVASYAQVSFDVKAGMNLSNATGVDDADPKIGVNAGVGMEYRFSEMWSIQPSLMFSMKGFKASEDFYKTTASPMYIQLPVLAAVRFGVAANQNVVVKAGPYFAYGVGGKYKLTTRTGAGGMETEKGDIFGGENGWNRFDAGLAFGIDYEIGKFFVGLGGEIGITKLSDQPTDDMDEIDPKYPRNLTFTIGVGYKF